MEEWLEVMTTPGKKYSKADKYVAATQLEKIFKQKKDELKEDALNFVDSRGGAIESLEHRVSVTERKNWDFSSSPEHKRLNLLKSSLEKNMKAAAETSGDLIIDGEVVPKAEIKSVTKSLTVR